VELETKRIPETLIRLLDRAREHAADPHLFAALVSACRFGGLLEASIAADRRARRLDPHVRTGITHTYRALAEYDVAVQEAETRERSGAAAQPLDRRADRRGTGRHDRDGAPIRRSSTRHHEAAVRAFRAARGEDVLHRSR
jgi:hypothetical protein